MSLLTPLKKQRFVAFYIVFTALAMGGALIYAELPRSRAALTNPLLFLSEQPSIASKPVFTVTEAFSDFDTHANYLFLNDPYNYKTGQEIKTQADMKALTQKRMVAYDKARQHLKDVLEKAMPTYNKSLQSDIKTFLAWLDKQPASALPFDHKNGTRKRDLLRSLNWSFEFSRLKKPIYTQLREINGFADIEHPEEAAIMLAVPGAINALKKHPNDPTLCTVMAHSKHRFKNSRAGRKLTAQQIAFFDVGDKYCQKYFHSPAGWAELYEGNKSYDNSNPYDKLSYKAYYQQELLPRLPEAKKVVQEELSKQGKYANQILCGRYPMAVSTMQRNPKVDAKQLAYKILRNKQCSPPKLRSFDETPILCLMKAQMFCNSEHKCDTIQRCAKQTKPIVEKKT